jgi:hypothetical protein
MSLKMPYGIFFGLECFVTAKILFSWASKPVHVSRKMLLEFSSSLEGFAAANVLFARTYELCTMEFLSMLGGECLSCKTSIATKFFLFWTVEFFTARARLVGYLL